jgi:two-component system, chemotaxis family, sensor kinase Cph1
MLRVSDSGPDAPPAPGDGWMAGPVRDAPLAADLNAAIDQHVAVACTDDAGRITFVNRAFCRLTEHAREELLGQDYRSLEGSQVSHELCAELRQTLARGDSWTGELERRAKDGSPRWVAATIAPLGTRSAAGACYVCICTDITGAKSGALQALERHEAQQRQTDEQYAHAASHDLQEPLRAIVSCGQLLEQDFAASVDATAKQLIAHMVEGGKRMQRLVLDLLAYARTGTHPPRLVCASSHDALTQALARLHAAVLESGAQIDAQDLPPVLADPQQLVELFYHLSSNALAYRGAERPIIRVRAVLDGAFWRFSLSDNGIGIEPASQRRIFYLFQRLHARHEPSSRGLGLPLCEKIVERHGGRIWVESERGRGATFYFTLPASLALRPEAFE